MRVVYVAGPYTAENAWQREHNIRRAEAVAHDLLARKELLGAVAVICVHAMARFRHGSIPEDIEIEADMELLRRSDAVVLVEGWECSKGTQQEIRAAWVLGKPIYGSVGHYVCDAPSSLRELEPEFDKSKDESDFCRALWKKVLDETKKEGS